MKDIKKGNGMTKQRNQYKQQTIKWKEGKEERKSLINYVRSSKEEWGKNSTFGVT